VSNPASEAYAPGDLVLVEPKAPWSPAPPWPAVVAATEENPEWGGHAVVHIPVVPIEAIGTDRVHWVRPGRLELVQRGEQ